MHIDIRGHWTRISSLVAVASPTQESFTSPIADIRPFAIFAATTGDIPPVPAMTSLTSVILSTLTVVSTVTAPTSTVMVRSSGSTRPTTTTRPMTTTRPVVPIVTGVININGTNATVPVVPVVPLTTIMVTKSTTGADGKPSMLTTAIVGPAGPTSPNTPIFTGAAAANDIPEFGRERLGLMAGAIGLMGLVFAEL